VVDWWLTSGRLARLVVAATGESNQGPWLERKRR